MALQEYLQLQADVTSILHTYGTRFKLSRPTEAVNGVVEDKVLTQLVMGAMDNQLAVYFNTTHGGIVATDKKTIYLENMQNGKIEPEIGDLLSSNKVIWRVVQVEVFRPDGVTTIAYQLEVT